MLPLSYSGLAVYAVVLIGAFAVRSAAGFGAVLVAVPLLALVMPLPMAVSVATALTLVTSIRYVSRDWRHIAWRQFSIIMVYTLIGVGLGFYFISMLDEHALQRGLGVFLILYAIYVLATGGVPPRCRRAGMGRWLPAPESSAACAARSSAAEPGRST